MNKAEINEDRILAMLLIDTWTLTTGRRLRKAPPCQLSETELIDFLSDDLMAEPNPAPDGRRNPARSGP